MPSFSPILEQLKFWNKTPKLPPGDPVVSDKDRNNLEMTASEIMGGLTIQPKFVRRHYATLGKKGTASQTGVEIHVDNKALQPYSFSSGQDLMQVPALMKLPQRGLYDFQVIVTVHPVDTTNVSARYATLRENEDNEAYLKCLRLLEKWDSPRLATAQARNLWVAGGIEHIHPDLAGYGGLGGHTMRYEEAGDDLYMLINRRRANHKQLTNGVDKNLYPLDYACPHVDEHDNYLDVEDVPYAYFKGGQMDADTLRALQHQPVDILIRLEFIRGSNKLFTTACLRISASPLQYKTHAARMQHLNEMQEKLKDLGGWKRMRGHAQMDAFRRFLPGNPPLPHTYGQHEVTGWSRVEEPTGFLQLLSEGLCPVGEVSGNFTVGFVGTYPFKIDDELSPSYLVTGTSKRTGKTGTVAALVLKRGRNVVWVDFTSSPLDSTQVWGLNFGGVVYDEPLQEADEILIAQNPSRRPTDQELAHVDAELDAEDKAAITIQLEEALTMWRKKGRITGLPWIFRPHNPNSVRYLRRLAIFFELLPVYTQQFYLETGRVIQVVGNDFSRLLELMKEGDARQQAAAQKAGAKLLGYLNQGANHGISTWIITHGREDPSHLVGRDIYADFSWHFDGGLDKVATYRYALILPKTGEVQADLNLRIDDDDLIAIVGRLSPEQAKEIQKAKQQKTLQPHKNGKVKPQNAVTQG